MYKLINTGTKYELHRHDSNKYEMIFKVGSNDALLETAETFAPKIQQPELIEALRFMVQHNHNVAEFGYNGTFTVSYQETIKKPLLNFV